MDAGEVRESTRHRFDAGFGASPSGMPEEDAGACPHELPATQFAGAVRAELQTDGASIEVDFADAVWPAVGQIYQPAMEWEHEPLDTTQLQSLLSVTVPDP